MLDLYSTNVTATANMIIPLNGKAVQRGDSATLASNGTDISLNYPGIYEVNVNAYGTVTGGGTFGIQLNAEGNPVERAEGVATAAASGDVCVAFSTLVTVNLTSGTTTGTINLEYTGAAGEISLVSITVKRVA